MTLKNIVSGNVHYLFCQPMDEKIQTWPLCFPAKENCNTYGEGIVRLDNHIAV